jgi:putative SOS response-associated peptidase YedK
MCGRLVLTSSFKERIRAIMADTAFDDGPYENYNITPGQLIPVMIKPDMRHLEWNPWGYQPHAGHRDGSSPPLINARGETAHSLPSFRGSFAQRRCIIWADGFYEWKRTPGAPRPQPFFFAMQNQRPFPLAGLWTPGTDNAAGCLVITTEANQLMHPVHHRMPVILHPDGASLWLQPDASPETLKTMLQPFPSGEMTCHPVGFRVNRAESQGPELIAPVTILEQTELF